MKNSSHYRIFRTALDWSASLFVLGVALGSVHGAALKDSYNVPVDQVLTLEDVKWKKWKIEGPDSQPLVYQRGGGEEDSGEAPKVISEGSLQYRDAKGVALPSVGNRLLNAGEEKSSVLLTYKLNLLDSSLAGGMLEPSAKQQENAERSQAGWGAPNQTVWFSVLLQPNGGVLSISLRNSAYSTGPNGIQFSADPKKGQLIIKQDWPTLWKVEESSAKVEIDPGLPTWLVAKIETGPEWGSSNEYGTICSGFGKMDEPLPKPTGRLTVWINPLLGSAPDPATASAAIPLHEMRINTIWLTLGAGAEIDELRLDPEFSALIAK